MYFRSAGTLYAVSTLASVASALFTGFLLIPNFGVRFLTMSIGLVLIFTGSVGITVHKKSAIGTVAIVLLCAAGFYDFQKISYSSVDRERGLLAIEQSAYAEIRVIEKEGYRYLLIDGGVHSICDTDSSASVYPYVEVMDLPKYFFEEAGDMLLIGLGGGSLVTNYVQNGWTVDAVEIDSVVSRVAFQYFDLDPASFRLFHMDGRQYLTNTNRRYDVLLMDAFGSGAVPFHLATRDYFQLIKTRLKDGGILAINIESVGWKSRIIAALAKTLQQAFAHVMVLPVAEPPDALGNLILLATESNAALVTALEGNNRSIRQKFQENYAQVHAWDNRFFPEINDVPTITDDFNPIELWSESVNYAARKDLHRFFGSAKLSW
ncbi:MAG: fused MFS/spermidine synthase [Deferribacteres bacterium]|nr:fused MFS/spermidine synthase [Deferribacteres bacterium]